MSGLPPPRRVYKLTDYRSVLVAAGLEYYTHPREHQRQNQRAVAALAK